MSWAVRASVLIVLQSRRGEWCTPAWIAGRTLLSIDTVLHAAEQLVETHELQFDMSGGRALFGVDVVAEHARINDVGDDVRGNMPGAQ